MCLRLGCFVTQVNAGGIKYVSLWVGIICNRIGSTIYTRRFSVAGSTVALVQSALFYLFTRDARAVARSIAISRRQNTHQICA